MKLSLKIFLLTLLLFIITFYSGIFLMSELSYAASLETARKQAFTEYNFIAYSFTNDLGALLKRNQGENSAQAINSLMSNYLGYYKKQDVFLQLINKGEFIAGNLPTTSLPDVIQNPSHETKSIIAIESAQKYIFVSCVIQNDYVLVYARDISSLVDAQKQLTTKLMLSGIGITLIYVIILFLIIRRLTKPIRVLQDVTKKITAGEYDVRANINGNDEVSVLAANFNNMAEEVLSKIEEHKKISSQKQQFIDNLAHELKTPLTAIYGNAELLQKTKVSEEFLIDASSNILQDVKRIQNMAKKLLDLALTRDSLIDSVQIELPLLFKKVHDELSTRLNEKKLEFITCCEANVICGDQVLIENLLINLLDNAIKASCENSKIFLLCYKSDHVVIEVRDEGIGISAEHLKYIFDPFYRTDFARSNSGAQQGGAGLGLALCKQIADVHGAKIEIESELNIGTKIKIHFTTS